MAQQQGWGYALQAAVNGYLGGKQLVDRENREKKQDERNDRLDAERVEDRKRVNDERTAVAAAATPVSVQEQPLAPVKVDDEGNPLPDLPTGSQFRVGAQTFADRATADKAALESNTDAGVAKRVADAQGQAGNYAASIQTRAAATQQEAAKFTLSEAQQKRVDEDFNQTIMAAGSPAAIAAKVSGSAMVGGQQVTAVKTADGKNQFAIVGPDGQQKLIGGAFGDKPEDLQKAIQPYLKIDAMHKLAFLHQEKAAEQAQANTDRAFNQSAHQFDVTSGLQRQQIGASQANAAATRSLAEREFAFKQSQAPETNLPPAVRLSMQGIDKGLATIETAMTKAQADGSWDVKAPGAQQLMERQAQLIGQRNALLKPYIPDKAAAPSAGGNDYMGYGGAPAAKPAPIAAQTQGQPAPGPGGGQPAPAAAAAPASAPAATPAPAAKEARAAYQSAKADREAAEAALEVSGKWNLFQRQKNPEGYRAAQKKVETLKAAEETALAEARRHQPAFNFPGRTPTDAPAAGPSEQELEDGYAAQARGIAATMPRR